MTRRGWRFWLLMAGGALALATAVGWWFLPEILVWRARAGGEGRVAPFGPYRYLEALSYEGVERSSRYLTVRDGTRLAVDLFRPTLNGNVVAARLPVIWTHHRYRRAFRVFGHTVHMLHLLPWLEDLVRDGYVVAVVDVRGSGASFGTWKGLFTTQEAEDAYDVTEWLAAQPFSNGKIGMFGRSYLGITQYMAARMDPPHLVAIAPEMAMGDLYALAYSGGIARKYLSYWGGLVRQMDVDNPAVPVDEDRDGKLLAAAVDEHRRNRDISQILGVLPLRDSLDPVLGIRPHLEWSVLSHVDAIRRSGVAIYHLAGWHDRYVRGQILLHQNLLGTPQKLVIGPWSHTQSHGFDFFTEYRRWFDYWLKDIDNGIMDAPPVQYATFGAPTDRLWRTASEWPPPQARPTPFYFLAGPSGSVTSVNDGRLDRTPPAGDGSDSYPIDYAVSIEPAPRYSTSPTYGELNEVDVRALTYTTPPLDAPLEVTGHPIVHLWVTSTDDDGDVFVFLEDVDAAGISRYVSEGALRISHRALAEPLYDNLGLPYHRSYKEDLAPLTPGDAAELVFDVFPTSYLFETGHRIRVTVTGADHANAATPQIDPPSTLAVLRGASHASRIVLPVM